MESCQYDVEARSQENVPSVFTFTTKEERPDRDLTSSVEHSWGWRTLDEDHLLEGGLVLPCVCLERFIGRSAPIDGFCVFPPRHHLPSTFLYL